MLIKVLVENHNHNNTYKKAHGLSIYIESQHQKIIFDFGPNNTCIHNARALNVNLDEINIGVVSHGHMDHGGGLDHFLKYNDIAKVYVQREAFNQHYTKLLNVIPLDVGLNRNLVNNPRLNLIDGTYTINQYMTLFTSSKQIYPSSPSNKKLYRKIGQGYIHDDFRHEQSLIIEENGKYYLFAGCSHKGIINIIEEAREIVNHDIDYVFGGFHLYNPISRKYVTDEYILGLIEHLNQYNTAFFTCHCTGIKTYEAIKHHLKDKAEYIKSGTEIRL